MVRMTVGGKDIDFLVDTGAEHSVVTTPVAPLSKKTIDIIGATGVSAKQAFCLPWSCTVGGHKVIHQFLYVPDCPLPLLGRDLLSKLRATISFTEHGSVLLKLPRTGVIMTLTVPREEEWRLFLTEPGQEIRPTLAKWWPRVWAEDNPPGLAVNQVPVLIEVKPGAQPVRQKQYLARREALEGIQVHLKHLRTFGIIVACQSPWNTPLLPVPKPGTKDYRPVQDLCLVNQATVTLHPTVPNLYTLLGLLPAEDSWFTCLDLKDAFFSIRLAPESQKLFAFQWEDPESGVTTQYTLTRLPQGFKNSPTIFGEVLARDLQKFPTRDLGCVLLQYVDDLLLGHPTAVRCAKGTDALLQHLEDCGYKVSKKKAQICRQQFTLSPQVIECGSRTGT
ncbi:endogenous retrovirus group K member 25 Pol protein isoform X1 [Pongo pygmaeus]|uniref:endogenous retrovirus group K member 25 Pol protein isoform X1 n=1 Tax=Pongo pygmaeus TaxID=9600 RepID=UPI00300CE3C7